MSEASDAVREVADREGLDARKLSRGRVKRIASRVKDVVSNAIEE